MRYNFLGHPAQAQHSCSLEQGRAPPAAGLPGATTPVTLGMGRDRTGQDGTGGSPWGLAALGPWVHRDALGLPHKCQGHPWPCPHTTAMARAPREISVPEDIPRTRGTEAACSPGKPRVVGSVSEPVQNTFFLAFPFLKPLH